MPALHTFDVASSRKAIRHLLSPYTGEVSLGKVGWGLQTAVSTAMIYSGVMYGSPVSTDGICRGRVYVYGGAVSTALLQPEIFL